MSMLYPCELIVKIAAAILYHSDAFNLLTLDESFGENAFHLTVVCSLPYAIPLPYGLEQSPAS